jgi:hypothetical protein
MAAIVELSIAVATTWKFLCCFGAGILKRNTKTLKNPEKGARTPLENVRALKESDETES